MVVFITARALAFLSGNKNCQQLFVREFGLSELLIHFSKGKRPGSVRLDGLTQGGEEPHYTCAGLYHYCRCIPLCDGPQIPVPIAQLATGLESYGPSEWNARPVAGPVVIRYFEREPVHRLKPWLPPSACKV